MSLPVTFAVQGADAVIHVFPAHVQLVEQVNDKVLIHVGNKAFAVEETVEEAIGLISDHLVEKCPLP